MGSGVIAIFVLAGCGGGEGAGTAPGGPGVPTATDVPADNETEIGGALTIEAEGTTVTIEPLGGASFLDIRSDRAGRAALRTGTCESPGDVVVDFGEFSEFLASEVDVKFEELTGGRHVLTIDSFCVELEPE